MCFWIASNIYVQGILFTVILPNIRVTTFRLICRLLTAIVLSFATDKWKMTFFLLMYARTFSWLRSRCFPVYSKMNRSWVFFSYAGQTYIDKTGQWLLRLCISLRLRDKKNIGTFRSDDGDGNENVIKAIVLISKTTTLHVHRNWWLENPEFTF